MTFSSVPRKDVQIMQAIKVMFNKQDFNLDSRFQKFKHNIDIR